MNLTPFHLEFGPTAKSKTLTVSLKILLGFLSLSILLTAMGCGGDDVSRFNDDGIPSPVGEDIDNNEVTPSDPGAPPATEQELEALPAVTVGVRQFSDPNVLVTLRGNAVAADNASISATLWTQVGGPEVEIPNPNQRESLILVPDLEEETQLLFRFVAQDSEGRLNSATTSVVVRPTPAFTRIVGSITSEEQDAAIFTVRLSRPQPGEVSVTYATQDGTAQAGSDYLAMEGTLVFAAGETENIVTVPILNNDPEEENEFFSLAINTFSGDTVTFNTGVALIQNNPELTPDIQNIIFNNPGPIALNVGDALQNIILAESAPGTGELTYESSNPQIASVDSEGNVTAITAGNVVIMATKVADLIYPLSVASYELNVTDVMVEPPALANLADQTLIIDEPVILRFINEGGGQLSSCEQTDLPPGLAINRFDNNTTCEISGTPTTLQTATTHAISAVNSEGTARASVTITVVNPPAPQLEQSAGQVYSIGSPIPLFIFDNTGGGGLIECLDIQNALPPGLAVSVSQDRSTCLMTGTPTVLQSVTSVDISARNVTGTSRTSINISVLEAIGPPAIAAAPAQIYTLRETIAPLRFGNTGGGELTACQEVGPLPDGLTIAITNDRTTCEISGTPTTILPAADYIVRATNREGSSDLTVSITVNDIVFTESLTFAYSNSQILSVGLAVTSGTARIDWGDGSATADVTNQDVTQIAGVDGSRSYRYPTSMNVNVTISFSEGVASLRGLRATPSGSSRLSVDIGTIAGASNLEVLSFSSLSNLVTGDVADLATNTPSLRELRVGRGGNLSGDISNLPRSLSILTISNAQGSFSGSIDNLPPNLTTFFLSESNTITGDIGNLPTSLESFTLEGGQNRVTGLIERLPTTLTRLDLQGLNTVSGDIDGIHPDFIVFDVTGLNTIAGDITGVVNNNELTLSVQGDNQITGDIARVPGYITTLQIYNGNNTLFGNIEGLHPNMRDLLITGDNVIGGNLSLLQNNGTIRINIGGNNTIDGVIGTLPTGITSLSLQGQNTLSGNIEDLNALSTAITSFSINGMNTVGGDIGLFDGSALTQFSVQGQNTITGNISNLLGNNQLNSLSLTGLNTVDGDISAIVNTRVGSINIEGANTLSGTVDNILSSSRLSSIRIHGQNTLSGDVVTAINPNRVVTAEINGLNTLSGDIGMLNNTSIRRLIIGGQNTLAGDIGLMTITQPDTIEISGLNTINQFTIPGNWTPPRLFNRLVLSGGSLTTLGFDSTTIDAALIFINDNTGGTGFERNISFSRIGDAPRTSGSDAAVAALQGKRFEVNTNPTPM